MTKAKPKKPNLKKSAITKIDFDLALKLFKHYYPDAHCALHYNNPFELLVATILSAQCTDERVNMVTPVLFQKFPTPQKMAKAEFVEVEDIIRSTGFYKNKAKSLVNCSRKLVNDHAGKVPANLEELVVLPGVGRKTANVVLGNAFGIASGVVVDTHVTRLANRFGWVKDQDAVKIETKLNKLVPQDEWIMISHYLISHGRSVCKARTPLCSTCFLEPHCPQKGV